MMDFNLNLDTVESFPVSGHHRGKRAVWRWTCVSKQHIRHAEGDESCGQCRVGLLNPLGGETRMQDMYLVKWTKQKIGNKKRKLARKGRSRVRPERRRKKRIRRITRAGSRTGELNVTTWNVRSLFLTGRRGAGHAEVLCRNRKCDVMGLKETRRPGRTEFAVTDCLVFCSGEDGSNGRTGQHGVELAVKQFIIREATWTQKLTNERLMPITFNLARQVQCCEFWCEVWPNRYCA